MDLITQANNKRNNVWLTFNGETKTVAQWARIVGISALTIGVRIRNLKWSAARALTEPSRPGRRHKITVCL